ncbi:MAG: CVNH domain-containing protein [Thermodesulfobacteriota bacterium]
MNQKYSSHIFIIPVIFGLLIFLPYLVSPSNAQTGIPPGSYKETCKDIQVMTGGLLWAQCKKADGNYETSTLRSNQCEGDISNNNGVLTCKKRQGKRPPSGSYESSCKDIRVSDGKLKASCERADGSWNNTKLNYKKCKGDISNNNGELSCRGAGGKIPKGSYRDSCKNAYVEGSYLYANCKKKNGGWNKSSINYRNCNKEIKNDNGNLVCGGGHSNYPSGSYKKSCKNLYMEGKYLEADCKNDNGKWKHSSINYKNCNRGIYNDNGKLRCNN